MKAKEMISEKEELWIDLIFIFLSWQSIKVVVKTVGSGDDPTGWYLLVMWLWANYFEKMLICVKSLVKYNCHHHYHYEMEIK